MAQDTNELKLPVRLAIDVRGLQKGSLLLAVNSFEGGRSSRREGSTREEKPTSGGLGKGESILPEFKVDLVLGWKGSDQRKD